MAAPARNKFRTYALTGSVAAITVAGAWYGAGLKADQELKQERAVMLDATPTERIEQMELARARLVTQRTELQMKIDRLTAKVEKREREAKQQPT